MRFLIEFIIRLEIVENFPLNKKAGGGVKKTQKKKIP